MSKAFGQLLGKVYLCKSFLTCISRTSPRDVTLRVAKFFPRHCDIRKFWSRTSRVAEWREHCRAENARESVFALKSLDTVRARTRSTYISIFSEEMPSCRRVNCRLCDENREGNFPAGKVARNRRNNVRAVVQTTGTALGFGTKREWRREMVANGKIKWDRGCKVDAVLLRYIYLCKCKERGREKMRKREKEGNRVGRHMSREFLRADMRSKIPEMDVSVSRCVTYPPRYPTLTMSRSMRVDTRATFVSLRFSMHAECTGGENIIYILRERWHPRELESSDVAKRVPWKTPVARKKGLHSHCQLRRNDLSERKWSFLSSYRSSLFKRGEPYSIEWL